MASTFDDTIASDYSKSTFSLAADNLGLKLIGAVIVMLLLIGWGGWFLFARIPFYETVDNVTLQPGGVMVAQFPTKTAKHLKYEQSALFNLKNSRGQAGSMPVQIVNIDTQTGRVELWLLSDQPKNEKQMNGQIKVQVERVTPLMLILRAAGLIPSS